MAATLKYLMAPPLNRSSMPSNWLRSKIFCSAARSTPGMGMWAIKRKIISIARVKINFCLRSGREKASTIACIRRGLDCVCGMLDLLYLTTGCFNLTFRSC